MRKVIKISLIIILLFPGVIFSQVKKTYSLPELLAEGLRSSPVLSARNREIAARKAAYQASKWLQDPELDLTFGRAKSYNGFENRNTQGITLSQSLENPLKRHYRIQVHKHDWQAAGYKYQYAQLQLQYEIKTIFYQILLLQVNEQLALNNYSSIEKVHRLIKKRADLGEIKQLEAIKLYVETLKAEKELNIVRIDARLARENLNRLLGNSLPSDFSLSGSLDYSLDSIKEEQLLLQFQQSHPRLKEKREEIDLAESNVNYNKWQRLPDFKLSGFSGKELDGRNKGIGISLNIPLWNFRAKEIAEAQNLELQQKDEYRALTIELSTEIKAKLGRLNLSGQNIDLYTTGLLKQAEASLKIAEISYKQGEISLIDFLDSQRTYYSIQKDYNTALFTWNSNMAALEKAVGEEIQ